MLAKIKRIPAKKFNRGILNRSNSTNIPTSKPQKTHHTRKERAIERWTPAQRLVVRSRPGKLRRGWMWWLELMCCWWWCFIHLRESQWLEWCLRTLALNTTVKRCVVSRRCNYLNRRDLHTARSYMSLCQLEHMSNFKKSSPVYHGWYHQSCWTGLRFVPGFVYEECSKCTWIVDLNTVQLLLNLWFAGAKTDGSMTRTPIKSFTKIKNPNAVYSDPPVKHTPISKSHTRKQKRRNASECAVWKCSAKFEKVAQGCQNYRSSRTCWKHTHTIILYSFQPTRLASECYAIGYGPKKSTHRRIGVTTNSPTKGQVEMVQLNS